MRIVKIVGWGLVSVIWAVYALRLYRDGEMGELPLAIGVAVICALVCAYSIAALVRRKQLEKLNGSPRKEG